VTELDPDTMNRQEDIFMEAFHTNPDGKKARAFRLPMSFHSNSHLTSSIKEIKSIVFITVAAGPSGRAV
jgi:hypothetical protein